MEPEAPGSRPSSVIVSCGISITLPNLSGHGFPPLQNEDSSSPAVQGDGADLCLTQCQSPVSGSCSERTVVITVVV